MRRLRGWSLRGDGRGDGGGVAGVVVFVLTVVRCGWMDGVGEVRDCLWLAGHDGLLAGLRLHGWSGWVCSLASVPWG